MTPSFVIATPHCPVLPRFQGHETVDYCEIRSSTWLGAAGPSLEGIKDANKESSSSASWGNNVLN
jgi:hypothetical protein